MNEVEPHTDLPTGAWHTTGLQTISAAAQWVIAAKRTHSTALIVHAQRELQAAVDAAREAGMEWGPIGTALGIARGNAYQRYRKRPSRNGHNAEILVVNHYHYPTP